MILRPFEVLNGIDTNRSSPSLALELIVTVAHGKEIFVTRIPADAGHILPLGLFSVDSAEETDMGLLFVDVAPLAVVEVIAIVIKDLVLFVLDDGSFHDL